MVNDWDVVIFKNKIILVNFVFKNIMSLPFELKLLIINYINHNNIAIFDYIIKNIKTKVNKANIDIINNYFIKNVIPVNPMKSFNEDFVLLNKINYNLPITNDMIKKLITFYLNYFDNSSYYNEIGNLNLIAANSNFSYMILILHNGFEFIKFVI